MDNPKQLMILTGPTASGKSDLAYRCACALKGCVINGDALQLYRELPLLTAQPILSPEENTAAPHHLYGVISGEEKFSVAGWLALAAQEILKSWADGLLPIVTGGTGMYVQRLLKGLAVIPLGTEKFIAQAEMMIARHGTAHLHSQLACEDKEKLHPHDRARLIRAYGIYCVSGKSFTQWQQSSQPPEFLCDARIMKVVLLPERDCLYRRCNQRLEHLFAAKSDTGIFSEVRRIADYPENLPISRTIGVAPVKAFLNQEISHAQSLHHAQKQTRNYAKRQYTWLKHQLQPDIVLPKPASDISMAEFSNLIKCITRNLDGKKGLPNEGNTGYDNDSI